MSAAAPAHFEISDWKARQNGTLCAFFTIILPSGLIIHDCSLHQKADRRWIGLPSREYTSQGQRKFSPIVAFTNRDAEDRFRFQALAAIDRHFSEATT